MGKTMLANCLRQIGCRRRHSVLMLRTVRVLKRLTAARLDASYDQGLRRLIRVDLLLLDDFALQAFDHRETQDISELMVERHRRASLVAVSPTRPRRVVEPVTLWIGPLIA